MDTASLLLSPSPVPLGPARPWQTCHKFSYPSISFFSRPTVGLRACTCAADCANQWVDNLRSREDAKQAREEDIPCQPAAQTGRQSPALAGAKHGLISWQNNSSLCSLFSQNNPLLWQYPFYGLVPVEWPAVCSAWRLAAHTLLPHGRGEAPATPALGSLCWDSVATSGQGKVFSGKSPAQPKALGRVFSSTFAHSVELHSTAVPQVRRIVLGHSCAGWHMGVESPNLSVILTPWVKKSHSFTKLLPQAPGSLGQVARDDHLLWL